MVNNIFRRLNSTPNMMALFDDVSFVQAMLDFERALAFAQAENGFIAPYTAEIIGYCCDVLRFDLSNLVEQSAQHGTIVVPLVRQLTEIVAEKDRVASNWVHFGATSQDTIDTAMMMQLKKAQDFVIGTGKQHSVKDFLKIAFKSVNLNYKQYVEINKSLIRKQDINKLIANSSKAKRILKWKPQITFKKLASEMVKNEIEILKKNISRN